MFDRLDKLRGTQPVLYVLIFAVGMIAGWSGAYVVGTTFAPLIGDPVSRWLGYELEQPPLVPEIGHPKHPHPGPLPWGEGEETQNPR